MLFRSLNSCGTVELVLASSYHGSSSSVKEERILEHIREFLIERLLAALNLSYVAVAANFVDIWMEGSHDVYIDKLALRIYIQCKRARDVSKAKLVACTKDVPATIDWRPISGGLTSDEQYTSDLTPLFLQVRKGLQALRCGIAHFTPCLCACGTSTRDRAFRCCGLDAR